MNWTRENNNKSSWAIVHNKKAPRLWLAKLPPALRDGILAHLPGGMMDESGMTDMDDNA